MSSNPDNRKTSKKPCARLKIKVVPGASRSELVGWLSDTLKIRIAQPPERGKANAAVEKLLQESLGVPVKIISGLSSARKVLEIEGLSDTKMQERLSRLLT